MKIKTKILVACLFLMFLAFGQKASLPKGFVYGKSIIPSIEVALQYATKQNFVNDSIDGYLSNNFILTKAAALKLKRVQTELKSKNLALKVYDAYRPERAVNHFVRWALDLNDTISKPNFYPDVSKNKLFEKGYIAYKSGHSRGSTLDVTLIYLETKEALDMGSPYDFFGEASWVNYQNITATQKANRQLLQSVMLKHSFKNYSKEWWHFTLKNEPFPETYFDFVIE